MNKNKNRRIYGLIWFTIAALIVIMIFYKREQRTRANYEIQFTGVVYSIKKAARQYYDVYVTNGQKCMLLKDLTKRYKNYEIAVGDSLIKIVNTHCFIYKRKDSIIFQTCDSPYSIYFSDKAINCP